MSTTSTETPMELTRDQRDLAVNIIALALADEYLLYTKTRNYHWNVNGPRFHDRHNFFEKRGGPANRSFGRSWEDGLDARATAG